MQDGDAGPTLVIIHRSSGCDEKEAMRDYYSDEINTRSRSPWDVDSVGNADPLPVEGFWEGLALFSPQKYRR